MNLVLRDIRSDKKNTIRYVSNLFITISKNTFILKKTEFDSKFQSIKNKYLFNLERILNSINSNNDYRVYEINTEINELSIYIQNVISIFKTSNSEYFLKDIIQKFLEFLDIRLSELLKLDIYKN